ncbi:MAG: isoprenylcysteine carboxylmethyltransferase family protein [Pyrinomonadaceae bacterium]|nr:isoprenylcysteine carboxylmethyltransferase family protein [Pyrinomonadaceae bacterium]
MKIRQNAAVYFAMQGIAVIAWWFLLVFVPTSRKYFQLENNSETSLLAFWLADLSLLGIGSIAAAGLCFRASRHAPAALWLVVGAISYATFYCLAFAWLTDAGWLGVTLMFPAMIWSGNFAVALSPVGNLMFRQSKESSTGWIMTKTLIQIVVVWTLILVVFPYFIITVEDKLGVIRPTFPFQKIIAGISFFGISFVGLGSSYTMSKIGRGTPLPLDATKKLVVAGTYSYVRNPMAISGIGQGIAIALFLSSPLVLVYALMGGFIWQFIFRPLEEENLREKFGADYENYRKNVRCWIPNRRAFRLK